MKGELVLIPCKVSKTNNISNQAHYSNQYLTFEFKYFNASCKMNYQKQAFYKKAKHVFFVSIVHLLSSLYFMIVEISIYVYLISIKLIVGID